MKEEGIPVYLKTMNEKYVFVESRGEGSTPQMVVRSFQKNPINSRKVTVRIDYRDIDGVKCMAFCFKLKKKTYYPLVTDDGIRFEENVTEDNMFWFRWGEQTGHWRTVISVAKPDMSLCECNKGKVIICSHRVSHFRIRFNVVLATSPVTRLNNISMNFSTKRMVVTEIGNHREEKTDNKKKPDKKPVKLSQASSSGFLAFLLDFFPIINCIHF